MTPADLVPRRVGAPELADHLEIITRAVFQAGLSWAIIARRWDTFVKEFSRFDSGTVAAYGEDDVERLMAAPDIIHSRKKIAGTVHNASALLDLHGSFGSIAAYVATFSDYSSLRADVHGRFAFVGDLGCYYWLFRTGQRVPPFERWIAAHAADHPRMREMVLLGRAEGTSSESIDFAL